MKRKKYFKFYSIKSLAKHLGVSEGFLIDLANKQDGNYKFCQGVMIKNKSRDLYKANTSLKIVLNLIDKKILNYYDFPKTFQGGIRGRALRDNAQFHTGKKYILKIDIADFFPSISPEKIFKTLKQLQIADKPASLLTTLVTVKNPHPHLPQGFCTSPKIASLVLLNLEKRFHNLFKEKKCDYSFWVDDITFSSDMPIGKFKNLILKILKDEGFSVNQKKIELLTNKERMVVTGVVVNSFPTLSNDRKKEIEKPLYCLVKFGIVDYFKKNKIEISEASITKIRSSLLGKINFAKSINPELGINYKKLEKCGLLRHLLWAYQKLVILVFGLKQSIKNLRLTHT